MCCEWQKKKETIDQDNKRKSVCDLKGKTSESEKAKMVKMIVNIIKSVFRCKQLCDQPM